MTIEIDFNDPTVPASVKEWYLEQQAKQAAAALAARSFEEDRGNWTINRHPLAPKPLTTPEGDVLHRDPVMYSDPLPPDKTRAEFLKRQLGLE